MEVSFTSQELFWLILSASLFTLFLSACFAVLYFLFRKRVTDQELAMANQQLEQQENLLKAQVKGRDQERERIAKEIHDEIGSKLAILQVTVNHLLDQNDNVNGEGSIVLESIEGITQSTQNISHGLLPPDLEHGGLVEAIKGIINKLKDKSDIEILFRGEDRISPRRFRDKELGAYYILNELIHNSLKYSDAKSISVQVLMNPEGIYIDYKDDGRGFDIGKSMHTGLGLSNVISRAKIMDGEYHFDSAPNKGVHFNLKAKLDHD